MVGILPGFLFNGLWLVGVIVVGFFVVVADLSRDEPRGQNQYCGGLFCGGILGMILLAIVMSIVSISSGH